MPSPFLSTFGDLIDFSVTQSRGGGSDVEQRDVRAAAFLAYQKLGGIHDWQFYRKKHRVQFEAAYETGTVVFDLTGGTQERLLTLTGGTFPSWAASGRIIIDDVVYEVERYIDSTNVTLDANFCPAADVASTAYTLIRSSYALPWDFMGMWEGVDEKSYQPHYVPPEEWLQVDRIYSSTSNVWYFTILPSTDSYATWQLLVHGYPTEDETFDFLYQGRPRPIRYTGYESKCRGTFGASAAGVTVTGVGTSFDSSMIGSVLRTSTTSDYPTGIYGLYPWTEQKTIVGVTSTTVLTVDTAFDNTYSAKPFVISDPLDIDENLNQALIACTRAELAKLRSADSWPQDEQMADKMIRIAMENEPRPKHARWSTSIWVPPTTTSNFDKATISNS